METTAFKAKLRECFEIVRTHLLTQNKKSEDTIGCRYRGPENTKCAIGCLIPDELYSPDMERGRVAELFNGSPFYNSKHKAAQAWRQSLGLDKLTPAQRSEFVQFLTKLQMTHDQQSVDSWETELTCFERNYIGS